MRLNIGPIDPGCSVVVPTSYYQNYYPPMRRRGKLGSAASALGMTGRRHRLNGSSKIPRCWRRSSVAASDHEPARPRPLSAWRWRHWSRRPTIAHGFVSWGSSLSRSATRIPAVLMRARRASSWPGARRAGWRRFWPCSRSMWRPGSRRWRASYRRPGSSSSSPLCFACSNGWCRARSRRRAATTPSARPGSPPISKNGGTPETAATMANHSPTRTTQLYDRRPDDATLDEVERVLI